MSSAGVSPRQAPCSARHPLRPRAMQAGGERAHSSGTPAAGVPASSVMTANVPSASDGSSSSGSGASYPEPAAAGGRGPRAWAAVTRCTCRPGGLGGSSYGSDFPATLQPESDGGDPTGGDSSSSDAQGGASQQPSALPPLPLPPTQLRLLRCPAAACHAGGGNNVIPGEPRRGADDKRCAAAGAGGLASMPRA